MKEDAAFLLSTLVYQYQLQKIKKQKPEIRTRWLAHLVGRQIGMGRGRFRLVVDSQKQQHLRTIDKVFRQTCYIQKLKFFLL